MRALVTGGAGYIGSLLTGVLLEKGYHVTVVDDLLFGGESLLGYWHHPNFRFIKGDVCDPEVLRVAFTPKLDAVVHLAAIVGFPACQAAGREVVWRYNVEATKNVFEWSEATHVERFIFASTYSNYGLSKDGNPVDEEAPLYPQSLYAETKIAAEEYLLERGTSSDCAPLIFRFATLFGISPRTRLFLSIENAPIRA